MENGMNTYACRYAVVQFVPYTETEEFANVGVVLACPETGFFDFKLQTRRVRRVTAFFDELPGNVYRHAVRVFQGELERVKGLATQERSTAGVRDLFKALIHPREAIVRFGRERVVLATDPALELQRLYEHYVERSFATPEYVETTIGKRLRVLLDRVTPERPFRPERIGDEDYYANFPLVQKLDGVMHKVIKPFNLGHEQTVDIYDHGEMWIAKIKRLRNKRLLPEEILFALSRPSVDDIRRRTAADEICTELTGLGIQTLDENADAQITSWALNQRTPLQ
jgi:Protein of unknown function (DUF3037)